MMHDDVIWAIQKESIEQKPRSMPEVRVNLDMSGAKDAIAPWRPMSSQKAVGEEDSATLEARFHDIMHVERLGT